MKIEIEITPRQIADQMVAALENSVTVQWCCYIVLRKADRSLRGAAMSMAHGGPWYDDESLYRDDTYFEIEAIEVVDEGSDRWRDHFDDEEAFYNHVVDTGAAKRHKITPQSFREGLAIMAKKCGTAFGDILSEDGDANTADLFLQYVVLKEEVYG